MNNSFFLGVSGISLGAGNNAPNISLSNTVTSLRETRGLPALNSSWLTEASGISDYRNSNSTSEGTTTAYHGLMAEILGYEAFRGNTSADTRLNTQLSRWFNANEDLTGQGGLAVQYDIHPVLTILAAKLTPRIWDALSSGNKTKCDLMMQGASVGAAFSGSSTSPLPSQNVIGGQNQPKNTPNWRTSIPATLWAYAVYLGGYGNPDFAGVLSFLQNFDRSTFRAACVSAGLNNLAETFKERGGSTGFSGPTPAQLEGALDSWKFVARTGTTHWDLDDVEGILKAELEFCFSNTIESGLNGGVGVTYSGEQRGLIMANAANLPNPGQTGMLHQLNTTDGGGSNSSLTQRSAMSYAVRNYFNAADIALVCLMGGIIDPSTISGAVALADRCKRGVTDFLFKHNNGYKSFSKGGGVSNNEDWEIGTSLTDAHHVTMQTAVWNELIDPWLHLVAKPIPSRVAQITVTDDGTGTNVISLSGTDSSLFTINGSNLVLIPTTALSYSSNPVLDVTVNVDDSSVGSTPDSSTSLAINIVPTVELIGNTGSYSGDSATFTNYLTGDLLVAQVFRGADTTSIVPPDGWTVIGTPTAGNNIYSLQAYRWATTDGADTLGTWTNASSLRYYSIRNANPTNPIASYTNPVSQASSSTVNHPAMTINNPGNNLVLEASHIRQTAEGSNTGLRSDLTSISLKSTAGGAHSRFARSTNYNVTSWPAQSVNVLGSLTSGGSHVMVVEIAGVND